MGSWWAYYELGWGGWWFWDPVENASFMPWLAGTALLHSALVVEKRDALKVWTVLLAIIAFSLSLIGTFLVRSGVLTSVHAFAVDPERGVFILVILTVFIGGSLALYAWRAPALRPGGLFAPVSREGALVVNNLLLTVACAAVFIGTLYPLVLEAVTGEKISVGAPFFDATFAPIMVPLLLLAPFGPFLAWKRADLAGTAQRLLIALAVAVFGTIAAHVAVGSEGPLLAPLGIGLGLWLIAGAFSEILWRIRAFTAPLRETLRRAANLPRAQLGTALAHAGVGVVVLGITGVTAWRVEQIVEMQPGDTQEIAGYTVTFDGVAPRRGPNYSEIVAGFRVARHGRPFDSFESSKRAYDVQQMTTTEAGIITFYTGDLYVAIGDEGPAGLTVRLWYNPLVPLIWFGSIIMTLGGLISLSDRRLRIGAPRRAHREDSAEQGAPA
jgi:cytochrome c-type biogenesis protein CcmF